MTAPAESAAAAFTTSAFSLKALAAALAPLMPRGAEHRRAGLRRHRGLADLRLDGGGQGGAGVGLALPGPRPRARPGSASTSSPPARWARSPRRASPASSSSPSCGARRRRWAGTSPTRGRWRARSAGCCRTTRTAISGEIVHVDGGFHAVGAPPVLGRPAAAASAGLEPQRNRSSSAAAQQRRDARGRPRR